MPDEDELDQEDRREDQRFLAPVIFGPLAGSAASGLLLIALTALGIKVSDWLSKAIFYSFGLVLGPFAVYRLTRSRPDWVEAGLVDDRDDGPADASRPNDAQP